jgi:hypothetical protein
MGSAAVTVRRAIGSRAVRAWTSPIPGTARTAFASTAFRSGPALATRATFSSFAAKSLAHGFAHRLPLFVTEFAVAIFVEFFRHAFAHLFARCLPLLVAQFAVAIFVVLFEHPLAHFLAAGTLPAFSTILRRLRKSRQA